MTKLTDMQFKFIQNYVSNGFNGYQAAIEAGYSESYALCKTPALIKHPLVKQEIAKAYIAIGAELESHLAITVADKCRRLVAILDDIIPINGEPNRQYYGDAIKALDMLNKIQGHYMPDRKVSVTVDATKERLKDAKKIYDEY